MKTLKEGDILLIGAGFMIAVALCMIALAAFLFMKPFASTQNKLTPSTTFHSCTIPANSQWIQENCYVEEHDDFNKWNCKDGSMLLIMKGN